MSIKKEINSLVSLAAAYSDSSDEGEQDFAVSATLQPNSGEKGVKRRIHEDVSDNSSERTRMKLEIPTGVLDMFQDSDVSTDSQNIDKHHGRIRSFDHFPGNWATHVLISFVLPDTFPELVASLKTVWPEEACELHTGDLKDFHVSISRTVPIRHHWIDPLKALLQRGFNGKRRFVCNFPTIGVYVNDEKTRTFLALKVGIGVSQLEKMVAVVDKAYEEFDLPKYYEKSSFHASFAWSLGDSSSLLQPTALTKLQALLDSYAEDNSPLVFTAKEIECRTGNKAFRFPLTEH